MSKARNLSDFISDPAIDSTELGDASVTTAKLVDQAVTPAKLHNTLDLSSKTVTLATDGISGNSVHGGVISDFASTGIDDNASSTALTIDSSGNVGIGTTTPGQKLTVSGNLELYNNDTDGYIWFHDFGTRSWTLGSQQSSGKFVLTNTVNIGSNEVVVVDTSGNVGIGTTSPQVRFEVKNDSTWDVANFSSANTVGAGITLNVQDLNTEWSLIAQGSAGGGNDNNLGFHLTNAGTSGEATGYKIVMTPSAQLGINTVSPTNVQLQINKGGSDTVGNGHIGLGGGSTPLWAIRGGAADFDLRIDRSYAGWQSTSALSIRRMNGFIGIGHDTATAKLQVGTNANSTGWEDRIIFGGTSASTLDSAISTTATSRARLWIAGGGEGQSALGLYNNDSGGTGGTIYMVSGYLGIKDKAGNNPFRIDMNGTSAHMVRILGDTAVEGTTGDSRGLSIYTAGGTSCPIYFGSESHSAQKSIYLSGYWMTYRGHQNEGHRFVFSQPAGNPIRGDEYRLKYNSATRPGGSTSWDGFSDRRAKENIRDMTGALDTIGKLRPVRYDWNDDYADSQNMWNMNKDSDKPYEWYSVKENGYDTLKKNDQYGFIAQEFEEVFPHDVAETELTLGDEEIKDFKTVNFDSLIPVLTKAIQEQQEIIEELKARLEAAGL